MVYTPSSTLGDMGMLHRPTTEPVFIQADRTLFSVVTNREVRISFITGLLAKKCAIWLAVGKNERQED